MPGDALSSSQSPDDAQSPRNPTSPCLGVGSSESSGSNGTTGTHRGARGGASGEERVTAVIHTRSQQRQSPDDDNDNDNDNQVIHQVTVPLGVPSPHVPSRRRAAIDELLFEVEGVTGANIQPLPSVVQALQVDTFHLLESILGIGFNPWISPSFALIGQGGEPLGVNVTKFCQSWRLECLRGSLASKMSSNSVASRSLSVLDVVEGSPAVWNWLERLDRAFSVSRSAASVRLLALAYLCPPALISSLRSSLVKVCQDSGGDRQAVSRWSYWVGKDMSEAAVDVRQAFKTEYNSYNAVVARWLKDVLEVINDRVRPKISLARTMSSWATLSLQEGESIESFLQRESELWLLLASHSAAADQSPFNWKERRERILSAILVVPSWRSSIGPWISALKTADNYSTFRELIKEAKKTILTLKALPKSEATLTSDNPMHFGPLPSTVFRGPTWKRSVDPHLPEPMSTKAPDSGVVSGACRSGPKADSTQGRGPRGCDSAVPKVETKNAQSTSRHPQRPVNKQKAKDRSEGRCFKCHVKGHLARDCPKEGEVEKTGGSKTVTKKAPAVNVTALSPRRVETAYVGGGEPFTDDESETSEPARLCACAVASPSQHKYDISSSRVDDLVYVYLTSFDGRSFKALVDPGSQLNLVEESVVNGADALARSDTSRKDMSISGIGGKVCGKPVTLKIYGPASKRVLRLKGYSVPELPVGSKVLLGMPGLRALKARLDLGIGEMSLCASALANNDKLPMAIESSSINITAHLDVIREHPIPRHRGYPLAPEKLEVAHKLVREMEDKGWIKIIDDKDTSQWFCPTFLKLKGNGKVRVLNDLREVNARIRSFASQSSFGAVLGGIPRHAKSFITLDISNAYHSVPVDVESQRFLGGVLGGIRFKWLVCPQGLSISPYFWELYLSSMLSGIEFPPQVTVLWYVDDIIICAPDDVSALAAKKAIISALVSENVMVAEEKCCGPARSVNFLGLVIDEHGWKPQEEPLDQLRRLPKPRNRGELHSFLGVVNYLRGVYDPSELQKHLAPLQDLLVKGRRFQWSEAHDLAFEWLQTSIKNQLYAHQPVSFGTQLQQGEGWVLQTDASDLGIACVLWRFHFDKVEDGTQVTPEILGQFGDVVSTWSRKLRGSEKRWAMFDLEGLALVEGLRRLRAYLSGGRAKVVVQSDSVVAIHHCREVPSYKDFLKNGVRYKRWCRWLEAIGDLVPFVRMEHIRGDSNNLADIFSRVLVDIGDDDETSIKGEIEVCPPVVLLGEAEIDIGSGSLLLCELPDDAPVPEELQRLYGRGRIEVREQSILYTDKKGRKRYYVPIMSRHKVLSIAHGDFHASTARMIDDLTRSLWWPGMRQDATDYVQKCVRCARSAAVQACAHPRAALTEVIDYDKDSARLWEAVSLDHAGPFVVETSLEKSGRVYVLIMVDMRSGFCEMKKVHSVTSTATTDAFYESWASRYGWPKRTHCDNAPCFRSAATIAVWERYGAKVTFSPPFWPRANGVSEAIVKELKTVMSKTTPTTEAELELSCAGARCAHNMSRSDGLPSSPMEVALGYQPRTAAGSLCDFNDGEDPFKRLPPDQYAATVENYLSKKALLREKKRKAADDVAGRYRPNSFGVVRENDLAFVVRRGSRRSGAIGPYRVTKIQGNRAWVEGLSGPVALGQLVKYAGNELDAVDATPPALVVPLDQLEADDWVAWETSELDGQVVSLDIGRIHRVEGSVEDKTFRVYRARRLASGDFTMHHADPVVIKVDDVIFSGSWLKVPLSDESLSRLSAFGYDLDA